MVVFITGSSSGIGKAIVEAFLKNKITVYGISRSNHIKNDIFHHLPLDLSSDKEKDLFDFPDIDNEEVILINNAGTIGNISPFHQLSRKDIRNTLRINTEALLELSLLFIQKFKNKKSVSLIHIGSGAANSSIKGWSTYCASKAAVHHFNVILSEEIEYYGLNNIRSIVISPGVIDTPMQEIIRSKNSRLFPDIERFKSLKSKNELTKSEEVAEKIIHIIKHKKHVSSFLKLKEYSI